MILLTVGTQFPFDRLVRSVDEALTSIALGEEVFAQVGRSAYRPRHFPAVAELSQTQFRESLAASRAVIAHAGIGTILQALDQDRPILVMPRRRRFGEVVNDHQVDTGSRLSSLGLVLLARDEREIPRKLVELLSFRPNLSRSADNPVAARLRGFLDQCARAPFRES